jgi:nucleoside-diphosphate-sugar epimerase
MHSKHDISVQSNIATHQTHQAPNTTTHQTHDISVQSNIATHQTHQASASSNATADPHEKESSAATRGYPHPCAGTPRVPRGLLVTGATTPAGIELIRSFLLEPHIERIIAVGAEKHVPMFEPWLGKRLRYLCLDLTRERSLRQLLFGEVAQGGIDTVIHTASHRWARHRGSKIHSLNVDATRQLLQICEQQPSIERFIYRGFGEVYDISAEYPLLIEEDHALHWSPHTPQWVRDRVEADMMVCMRMGMSRLQVVVLRCAECVAPDTGSQLYDYLSSRVCFQPLGFDPMLNLLSLPDLTRALFLAAHVQEQGIFNIPGKDTLPLSAVIERSQRLHLYAPGPLVSWLYQARSWTRRNKDFRYDLNRERFHLSAILDGSRASLILGYQPQHPILWSDLFP